MPASVFELILTPALALVLYIYRPCTPRKRLIAAQQEDRDVGFRITTLELSSTIDSSSSGNKSDALVREFSVDYVQKVLQTAVTTPRCS